MTLNRTLPALLLVRAALGGAAIPPRQIPSEVYFEPNRGQAGDSTVFLARGASYAAFLQQDGAALYRFSSDETAAAESIRMELLGVSRSVAPAGEQPLSSVTHYYTGGDPARWRTDIPHYGQVRTRGIYPGIDMLWHSFGSDLEYEFILDAGADPGQIQMQFRGARRVWIDRAGNLMAQTRAGQLRHRRPVAWQEIQGRRVPVSAGFRLCGAAVSFDLGRYDSREPLRIDPVLTYASYLGGAGYDAGYAIAVDGSGQIYVTGTTASVSFSAQNTGLRANRDAFVTKFSAAGAVLYTAILSSSGDDSGQAIAVDPAGNVYVAGTTQGNDFPASAGAWQTVSGGGEDGFAAKLNSSGNLVYATYLGGPGSDLATGIAIDKSGNAYVSGYTSSASGFPTTPGAAQVSYRGGSFDAFLVKLNPAGSTAVYATLLGGSGNDQALAIALTPAGSTCIAGYTDSIDLPVQAAVQSSSGGEGDAMIACLNAAGTAWTTVSYLGGSGRDEAYALAIDGAANLYLAGTTFSQDFPATPGAFQPAPAGGYDTFAVKIGLGPCLAYATLLGGTGSDAATALALGGAGDIWVAGYTSSFDFPVVGAWQSSNQGGFDAFAAHLNADGTTLLASSYLGGSQEDQIWGIALGPAGMVLVTGSTGSTNFPVTPGAVQSAAPGGFNAFLAAIDPPLNGYAISGQVTVSGAAPLAGATLTLSGAASGSEITDASGSFRFSGLIAGGAYTITPSDDGYSFSPASVSYPNLGADQTTGFTASCALSINPTAVFLDSTSQSGPPVYVTAGSPGCLWVASSNAEFIKVTAGTNGTGNGAVTFSVPANNTGAALVGRLSIDGQTVSITQRETPTAFADVNPPDYYFDFANVMRAGGISAGCAVNPPQYCPDATTTRGQMAVFIITAIEGGGSFTYTPAPYFSDVPPANPFFKFIQKMADLGITSGCSAGRYCPDDPVTRGQMAVFIIKARYGTIQFGYPTTPYFTDVPASSPYFPYVQKMAQAGITAGCAPGSYCSGDSLIRGQMSVFIVTGLLNQLLPATAPRFAGAAPNSAAPGQSITVTLTGVNTHFVQGATQVAAAAGISVSNISVTSPTSLTARFTLSTGAAPGPSSIVATTGTEEAVLPNGFHVL